MKEKGGGGRSEEDRSVVSVIADFDRARHPGRKEEGGERKEGRRNFGVAWRGVSIATGRESSPYGGQAKARGGRGIKAGAREINVT